MATILDSVDLVYISRDGLACVEEHVHFFLFVFFFVS